MKVSCGWPAALPVSLILSGLASALPQLESPSELPSEADNRTALEQLGFKGVTDVHGYPPYGVFELPEPVYPDQSVIQEWEVNAECATSYFNITNENNQIDSAFATWYWRAIQSLAKGSETEYDSKGEYRIFYEKYFPEAWDFRCDIHHNGCSRRYECDDVVRATRNRNPDLDTSALLELSRKVYFTHHRLWYLGHNYNEVYKLLQTVQTNTGPKVNDLVSTFTRQPNVKVDAICDLIKNSIKFGFDVITTAASFLPMGSMPSQAIKGAKEGLSKIAEFGAKLHDIDLPKPTIERPTSYGDTIKGSSWSAVPPLAVSAINWGRTMFGLIRTYKKATEILGPDHGHGIPGMENNRPGSGMCADMGGGVANQNEQHKNAIAVYVADSAMAMRQRLSNILDIILHGDVQDGVAGSILANMIASKEWTQVDRDTPADERAGQQAYTESIISGILRNQKCYQQCMKNPERSLCDGTTHAESIGHRYCSGEKVCQMSCITAQKKNNHNIPIYGYETVKDLFGISIQELGEISYKNFVQNERDNMALSRPEGNFIRSVLSIDNTVNHDFNLPVCESQQLLGLGDISGKWIDYHHPDVKHVPATCGDWRSNETETFMKGIGMDPDSTSFAQFKNGITEPSASREVYMHFFPYQLSQLPPLTNYIAMCRLGIKMPLKASAEAGSYKSGEDKGMLHLSHRVHAGKDKHCDAIIEHVKDMTEQAANMWFCNDSFEAKDVFGYQSKFIDVKKPGVALNKNTWMVLGPLPAHERQCQPFRKRSIMSRVTSVFAGSEDVMDLNAQYIDADGNEYTPQYSFED